MGEAEACAAGTGQGEPMALILEFRNRHAPAEPGDREETAGAQIIIFPGIRRERHAAAAGGEAGAARARRGRSATASNCRIEIGYRSYRFTAAQLARRSRASASARQARPLSGARTTTRPSSEGEAIWDPGALVRRGAGA